MTISIEHSRYLGWQAIMLSLNQLRLIIVPAIGGRILSLQYNDTELLFIDKNHAGETFVIPKNADLHALKQAIGFRLWGGDKTWIAPQNAWWEAIPPLALDAGPYEYVLLEDGLRLISPICRETGLQIERQIRLQADESIQLQQTIINKSSKPIKRGIWNVTQILQPAECFFKAPMTAVQAFANEGDSCALQASRVDAVGDWIRVDCLTPAHFKYGANVTAGIAKAIYHAADQKIALVKTFNIEPNAHYAHDTMVEVYNSPNYPYCELEIHAPCVVLQPGEKVMHEQRWQLMAACEESAP